MPGDPTVAERMELYGGGLELANGFAELTDAAEQRRRFEAHRAQRTARGMPPVPLDEAFLTAVAEDARFRDMPIAMLANIDVTAHHRNLANLERIEGEPAQVLDWMAPLVRLRAF